MKQVIDVLLVAVYVGFGYTFLQQKFGWGKTYCTYRTHLEVGPMSLQSGKTTERTN